MGQDSGLPQIQIQHRLIGLKDLMRIAGPRYTLDSEQFRRVTTPIPNFSVRIKRRGVQDSQRHRQIIEKINRLLLYSLNSI